MLVNKVVTIHCTDSVVVVEHGGVVVTLMVDGSRPGLSHRVVSLDEKLYSMLSLSMHTGV